MAEGFYGVPEELKQQCQERLREAVMQSLLAAIQTHLERRANGAYRVGALLFSNQYGLLGRTDTAVELLRQWKE